MDDVGLKVDDAAQCGEKALYCLVWQAGDKVDIQTSETYLLSGPHASIHLLDGLGTVDGLKDFRVKTLHSQGQAIDPQRFERFEFMEVQTSRVRLKVHLSAWYKAEAQIDAAHDFFDQGSGQERRSPSSQIQ
jgi:hypothetical protein